MYAAGWFCYVVVLISAGECLSISLENAQKKRSFFDRLQPVPKRVFLLDKLAVKTFRFCFALCPFLDSSKHVRNVPNRTLTHHS
jgi:hypothetical protein